MPDEKSTSTVDRRDVDAFIMLKGNFFPDISLRDVRDRLAALRHDQFSVVTAVDYKDPTVMLIISIFVGALGVDRFLLGQVGIGVGKLLTTCFCGIGVIWWLIDLFKISDDVKTFNYQKLLQMISIS